MEPVTLVILTFNEAETIGAAIRKIPAAYRLNIIGADGGSTDRTRRIARLAGARAVSAGRGYGRACALGAEKAYPASTVIAFMDDDGADRGDLIDEIARPVLDSAYDLVLASRTRSEREPGAMLWHQVLAGRIAGLGCGALYGVQYSNTCAFRAISRERVSRATGNLRLEYRDANEGGAGTPAYPGSATALPTPPRRQFEGGWLIPRHSPGREPYRRNVLPSCSVGELISARGIHAG
jgi:glycosyltransferase involved in cell wall biosynthesis